MPKFKYLLIWLWWF